MSRLRVVALLSVCAAGLVVASVAWACNSPTFGTPATPALPSPTATPPPPSAPQPVSPAAGTNIGGSTNVAGAGPSAPPPGASSSTGTPPQSPPVSQTANGAAAHATNVTSGSVHSVHSGTRHATATAGSGATAPVASYPVPVTAGAPVTIVPARESAPVKNINGKAALAARIAGKTGGFSHHGRQLVFASSAPSKSPSAASATGDLWGAVQNSGRPSIASAAASGSQSSGISSAVIAGLVIFGIGLIGLAGGGAYVVVKSRRRAVGSAGDSNRS